jgi:hypothetical protein
MRKAGKNKITLPFMSSLFRDPFLHLRHLGLGIHLAFDIWHYGAFSDQHSAPKIQIAIYFHVFVAATLGILDTLAHFRHFSSVFRHLDRHSNGGFETGRIGNILPCNVVGCPVIHRSPDNGQAQSDVHGV